EASVASELERTANGVRTRVAMASLYSRIAGNVRGLDREEAMRTLAEMEIGDRTTEAKSARQDEVERRLASVRTMATLETGKCQETPPPIAKDPSPVPLFEVWRQTLPSPL